MNKMTADFELPDSPFIKIKTEPPEIKRPQVPPCGTIITNPGKTLASFTRLALLRQSRLRADQAFLNYRRSNRLQPPPIYRCTKSALFCCSSLAFSYWFTYCYNTERDLWLVLLSSTA
eukprot:IDg15967t1